MTTHSPQSSQAQAPIPDHTDVLIIGDNLTGNACAEMLAAAGVTVQVVAGDEPSQQQPPPFFMGGLVDNFTRLHHAYGADIAARVWGYSQKAANDYSTQMGYPAIPKLRLHRSAHQQAEGREAQRLLAEAGLGSTIEADPEVWRFHPSDLLIHNEEGQGYALPQPHEASATAQQTASLSAYVTDLRGAKEEFVATLSDGSSLSATMVVIACERALIRLRPFYRDVLIPYSDQWQQYDLGGSHVSSAPIPDCVFYSDHGYVYGLRQSSSLAIGGGRFKVKNARIGDDSAHVVPEVTAYLHSRAEELLGKALPEPTEVQGFCEYRACDELPVIGPDFREPRLLVAGGYMGCGAGLRWQAGRELGALIGSGSATLPRELWPTRLRSL